ncbi:MAG: Cytoplasmic GTPase/eEF2-like protein (ribosomal biogenesis) [Thelocarpon impressellum]|nr:MAG: Cytoplasmic GTPase/eEF2-like protein (ribosomal biogenesis) [Thelocarpon impressellum]
MPVVSPETLVALQQRPEGIRNICILAHVDHGKTSLTDALIATNGIISPKLAGKIRYLDSRPDEQLRGITMESSAISLHFSMLRRSLHDAPPVQEEFLINLIDSPGHIDFSSEVSTASRLCDGAVVLVDAVEGVCSQTVTVLRQTWIEHLQPLLVINKIDRLITELKMTPAEAYNHLSKLLEQVNAVVGSFFQGERMEEDLKWRERVEERVTAAAAKEQLRAEKRAATSDAFGNDDVVTVAATSTAGEFEEKDDEDIYFAPEKNNVIFASAVDGWAFTVKQFAALYEKKLGIKRSVLEKVLWGDFYLDPKTKRVLGQKHLKGRALKPTFVQLVLDTIWAAYEATTGGAHGKGKRAEIAKAQSLANGDAGDPVAGVMNALGKASIDQDGTDGETGVKEQPQDPEHLIGFARLYSGTLNVGDELYVLPPKFSPATPHADPKPHRTTITALYLLMGRGLEPLSSVPAGVVFGVAGLEGHILKSGTLCSTLEGGVNLAGVSMGSQPIVRVALEPVNPGDLNKMIGGMRLLEQSDPCAEYEVMESGEHVILTAGELHLERCLKDLRERFARCEIQAGEPIVPYRETIVNAPEMVASKDKDLPRGEVIGLTTSKQVTIRLRVRPLPAAVTLFLVKNAAAIKELYSEKRGRDGERDGTERETLSQARGVQVPLLSLADFKIGLSKAFEDIKGDREVWMDVVDRIAAFGPKRLATAQGPLCNEPVQGIAVFLEDVSISTAAEEGSAAREALGRLTGEVIKTVRDSVRQGFLDWSPRLLLAMYSCEIQASTEVLGRVYAVLTRRRGRILSESLKEGTPFFTILSLLPVAESFGFSDEIRKRTSGAASPQLIFQGFEMLDEDPFWVPFTEEDLEDLGELADKENVAKRYMDAVRVRKGLFVKGRKLVKDAEKQKTLKR